MLAGDVASLDRLWADDFVVTPPDHAPKDKATALGAVSAGLIAYSAFARTVEQVRDLGDSAPASMPGCPSAASVATTRSISHRRRGMGENAPPAPRKEQLRCP